MKASANLLAAPAPVQLPQSFFFSTHVLDVAEKLCNKVAMIKEGTLIASGDMQAIVKQGQSLESIFMEVVEDAKTDENTDQTGTM